MKSITYFVIFILAVSCSRSNQGKVQKIIDPSEYNIISYQVKDPSFHDSVIQYLEYNPEITVSDSSFNVNENLGPFLFGGNNFNYEIVGDSLLLEGDGIRNSYKITHLDLNAFEIEVDNKYFERIYFIKPKDKRKEIVRIDTLKF